MDQSRWNTVERLFTEALLRPVGEREAYLQRMGGDNPEVVQEVREMLAELDAAGLSIEDRLAALATPRPADDPWLGRTVGPYRLERRIGEGGMGLVYLAERVDGAFERSVAVKVLARRLGHADAHRRFEEERKILARLDHPNVARLIDGGSVDGQPYLVMELVIGDSITDFCSQRNLSSDERVELFRTVCDAVQYAHQSLVVHRDLKPANILVTPLGRPKLLDFGIAKMLEPEAEITATASRLLTPEYASPEQVRGEPVTTASDVYALGGLLYRLLSGGSPYGDHTSSPLTLEQAIVELDPPSLVSVDRDLALIVEKALRKDPARRYRSAGELSDDLGRYLDDLPVQANPDSWGYRSSKFIRRHRIGVTLAAVGMGVVLAFGISTWVQARRLEVERNVARVAREQSDEVVNFLVELFEQNSPDMNLGADTLTLGTFLDQTEATVLEGLTDRPEVRVRMQEVLGRVNFGRARFNESERLLRAALEGRRELIGGDDSTSAAILQALVQTRFVLDPANSAPLAQDNVELHRRIHGDRHRLVGEALQDLATATADPDRRIALLEEALDIRNEWMSVEEVATDDERISLAGGYNELAVHFVRTGDYEQAGHWFEESLAQLAYAVPPEHPYILTVTANLALVLDGRGEYARSEEMHRRVLAARRLIISGPDPGVATNLNGIAAVVAKQGRLAEAIDLAEQSVAEYRAVYDGDHSSTANALQNLALYRWVAGEHDSARRLIDEAIGMQERVGAEAALGAPGSLSMRIQRLAYLLTPESAQAVLDTLQTLKRRADDLAGSAPSFEQGMVAFWEGWAHLDNADEGAAAVAFTRALRNIRESDRRAIYQETVGGLGIALAGTGQPDSAKVLLDGMLPEYSLYGLADPARLARMQRALDGLGS